MKQSTSVSLTDWKLSTRSSTRSMSPMERLKPLLVSQASLPHDSPALQWPQTFTSPPLPPLHTHSPSTVVCVHFFALSYVRPCVCECFIYFVRQLLQVEVGLMCIDHCWRYNARHGTSPILKPLRRQQPAPPNDGHNPLLLTQLDQVGSRLLNMRLESC